MYMSVYVSHVLYTFIRISIYPFISLCPSLLHSLTLMIIAINFVLLILFYLI